MLRSTTRKRRSQETTTTSGVPIRSHTSHSQQNAGDEKSADKGSSGDDSAESSSDTHQREYDASGM